MPDGVEGLPRPCEAEAGDAEGEKVSRPVGLVFKVGNPRLQPERGMLRNAVTATDQKTRVHPSGRSRQLG
jgi:hypothetical protein